MTKLEFIQICNDHTVDPSIVLDNDEIIGIIRQFRDPVVQQLALSTYLKENY